MKLSVVHFSTADIEGGSARSAWRLHNGLKARGHLSRMLVRSRHSGEPDVAIVAPGAWRLADLAADAVQRRLGLQYMALPSSMRLFRHEWLKTADVIQLFNVHGGYVSQPILPHLGRDVPIVWRLSDLWPITGHCAFPGDCNRWMTGCGSCPSLSAYPAISIDTTAYLWALKKRLYRKFADLTVVAPSSWTETAARLSPLFDGIEVIRIPNGLDISQLEPSRRDVARRELGISSAETVILFSAHVAAANPRKGTHLLEAAIRQIGPQSNLTLMVLGQGASAWASRVPLKVRAFEYTDDRSAIATINAAADLVVVPSTVENLPNSLLEAMAHAVPAVAFDVGGMRDAVVDGETGVLVTEVGASSLARGIQALTSDPQLRLRLGRAARALVESEFSQETELSRFEQLYLRLSERKRDAKAAA